MQFKKILKDEKMDTNKSTNPFVFAFILTLVVSMLLSLTATLLDDKIEENIEVDKKKNIIKVIGLYKQDMLPEDIVNTYKKSIIEVVIDSVGNERNDVELEKLIIEEDKSEGSFIYTYNNESYNFTYYYLNNIPEIEITSTTIASGKTTNDNSIDLILKEKNGLSLYDFDVTDITTEPNNNNYTITDFSGNGSSYTCTLNAAQDASIYFILNPGKYKNISNQFNTATSEFVWIRNTQPVTIEIYSNSINNNDSFF